MNKVNIYWIDSIQTQSHVKLQNKNLGIHTHNINWSCVTVKWTVNTDAVQKREKVDYF